ncbi:MAG: protein kinase [Fimbriiglobus sp.]|jgi:serine/threonine protein kinase|nr:protein kinase [Fimbriiglobus sp.]
MSVPTSVEELIQLIRKSGMVDEAALNSYLHRRNSGRGLASDPRLAAEAMVLDGLLTDFQAEQFLLGKWRGFTVGKYKLLERVGVGGMGQVFLCEHLFMKRRVAIKILPPAKAEQPAALGRFYREARAAGQLEHPNIVRTHDIDQDGNLHYIVMEYVDGSNLLDMVKKGGPMPAPRAAGYICQVAHGLQYAYDNGLIHRDIKPGNILVDREGTAKLLDMGLARFYQDQSDMLTVKYDDKIVLGTADYVAPEQVANSHAVDVRADVYALGGSLYFLLAGHPPFPTGTVSQKLLWHRTKDPTPLRQVRPEVPEGLAAVVAKMMHKDPAQRYQTPAEVAAELSRWAAAEAVLPTEAELPVLSKAARDTTERQSPRPVSTAKPASEAPKPDPSNFGTGGLRSSPFAAEPAVLLTAEPPTGGRTPTPGHRPSPFAPPTPTAAETVNELPGQPTGPALPNRASSRLSKSAIPGGFPIIASPPPDNRMQRRTYFVVGLACGAVVLAVALFLVKYLGRQPAAPVVEPTQTTQGQ